ncbi:MAG: VWA domain-containing protein [Deltaproteobacteria bacterium]|nr:VWA domain-containing protein [Deltaproteobacteria bacterium]
MRRSVALLVVLAACSDYDVTRSNARDGWIQEDRGADLDILWVLDDSGSMTEEQALLAARAASFASPLSAAELPYRLAVTTTSGTGVLLGELITEETADPSASFVAAIEAAGIEGEREESGFASALLAADPANNDFAREEADLEVVIYSDEDDHSELDPSEFLADLGDLHPGRSVVVSAVVGDPPTGCASATGAADPGDNYLAAQAESGGAKESICTADTDGMLERLAHLVLGLRTEFFLSALPLLDSMEVTVDGVVVPRRDQDGWRYDGGDNSIIFDGWSIPRPGATIEAFYFDYTGNSTVDTGSAE